MRYFGVRGHDTRNVEKVESLWHLKGPIGSIALEMLRNTEVSLKLSINSE
jgi:hypothetical protein